MRTRFVFVCNNPEELERLKLRGRNCVEAGKLAIYAPKPLSPLRMLALGFRLALRRVHDSPEYDAICASEVQLDSRRSKLPVSLDGEVLTIATPLRFAVKPDSLQVIVPTTQK